MSGTGPQLGSLKIWAKREGMCLAILERALQLLRAESNLPDAEVDLNRCLYFRLLEASSELYPQDQLLPTSECNNQPDPDDDSRAAREHKRPDFQWVYRDVYEPDPRRSSRQFVVECKRLGTPRRADRVFNVNYVKQGICRFREREWAYAKRFRSGVMIGYWQSMELPQILKEVNEEAAKNSLPEVAAVGGPFAGGHRSEHTFERPFPVSPFRLRHLWIDLRPASKTG